MLTGETRLVGLIGSDVAESRSPRMQNAAFAARALDWAYVPLPVERERLEAALAGLVALGFAGANVTYPYKTTALAFCDEIDEFAERAGSVNTLVIREGRLLAGSTDGLAVTGLVDAAGAHVLVLGAGGAAQAVATALADEGAERFVLAARASERAHALAGRLRALFPDHEIDPADAWPPAAPEATIVVNATPVTEERLIDPRREQQIVDLAYRADGEATALVRAARDARCERVVDGLEVLVRQGAASFERWTGVPAPVEVMSAAVRAS